MPYNSTIISKKKNLKCGHFDFNFSKSRCKLCATIESTTKRAEAAKNENKAQIPRQKTKPIQSPTLTDIIEISPVSVDLSGNKTELWSWFEYQRGLMSGFCHNCQRPSCKNDDKRFHFSLHHILDKAHFPSVSTHKSNVLELCFWGEGSCHTRADNKILELSQMACWDEIVTKFIDMYPSIARSERRRIPEILIQYIDVET